MLTKQQMLGALNSLINDGNTIYNQFLSDLQLWSPTFVAWMKGCESTIEAIYGHGSDALNSFRSIYYTPPTTETYLNEAEKTNANLIWYASGLNYAVNTLVGFRYSLERLLPDEPRRPNRFVFISHGGPFRTHVDATCELIKAMGLSPVVVSDMPNLGLSINEKVRFYMGLCGSAIVLATVEDETAAKKNALVPMWKMRLVCFKPYRILVKKLST